MTRGRLALVVSCGVLGLVACATQAAPCSVKDVVVWTHGAECAERVKACGEDGECKAIVRDDCNRWIDQRCGFAGSAGAP